MKKLVLLLAVLIFVGTVAFAAGNEGPLSVDFSGGLHYNAQELATTGTGLEIFEMILYMRAGVHLAAGFNINEMLTVGAEAGFLYMTWEVLGVTLSWIDVPLRGYLDVNLSDSITLRPFGGVVMSFVTAASGSDSAATEPVISPEAGARVILGGLYIEGSYVFATTSYPRIGVGYSLSLL